VFAVTASAPYSLGSIQGIEVVRTDLSIYKLSERADELRRCIQVVLQRLLVNELAD